MLACSEARGDQCGGSVVIAMGDTPRTSMRCRSAHHRRPGRALRGGQGAERRAGDARDGACRDAARPANATALLGKTLLNLDEEIGQLDFDVNASMRRNATQVMRRRMFNSVSPANVFATALEVRDFTRAALAARMNRIVDALHNDLRLAHEVIDHGWNHRRLPESREPASCGFRAGRANRRCRDADARADAVHDSWLSRLAMLLFLFAAGGARSGWRGQSWRGT